MRTKIINHLLTALIITATCTSNVVLAKKNTPKTPPTSEGRKLASNYTKQLKALKRDLTASLPRVDKRRISAYTDALAAEATAKSNSEAAQKKIDAIGNRIEGQAIMERNYRTDPFSVYAYIGKTNN
jgi:peptidoglycan hydrolase CwlO-like protein